MSRNILTIDIGTSSVKMMRFNKTLRGFKLIHFGMREYGSIDKTGSFFRAASRAIADLLADDIIENDFIISSISSKSVIVRNITLPFIDMKKIRGVVKYEIEPHTLFPIDDLIVDYLVTKKGSRANKKAELLVAAVEKKVVEEHLKILKDHNLEPDVLDIDSFALWNGYYILFRNGRSTEENSDIDKESVVSLIDIGAGKTSVNIIDEGRLIFTRSMPKAGNFITSKIMKDRGVSFAEAEKMKRETHLSDDRHISSSIESAVSAILKEIEVTFFSYYSRANVKREIKQIILTGGSSQIKDLKGKVEDRFNVKVVNYNLQEYISECVYDISSKENAYSPVSIGLGLKGANKGKDRINLRKEEFVLKKSYEGIKNILFWLAFQIFIILFFFAFDVYYHFEIKENRYESSQKQVRAIFKEIFPEVKNIVSEIQQMKSKIKQNEEKLKTFGGVAGMHMSALELLREVSVNIPKEIKLDVTEMTISQDAIRFSGNTDSFDALDNLKKNLQKSDYFGEFKIDNAKAGEDEKTVKFKASISLTKSPFTTLPFANEG